MRHIAAIAGFMLLLLTGCAAIESGGEVQAGRRALFAQRPDDALAHFQRAAQLNPDYVTGFSVFREGVWTYVGRSAYELKDYQQARTALETAVARHPDDHLGHLYLGLTLAQLGQRQTGLTEIQTGLKGLYDWLEYTAEAHKYDYGQYWDPTREIRSQCQNTLAMTAKENFDWPTLIAAGEAIGKRMEDEIDRASQEERFFRGRPGDNDSGGRP
jgi:tetratricopeptide (TPR) repeat protein